MKDLKTLCSLVTPTSEMAAVIVAKAYLKDCFAYELTVEKIIELKGAIPTLARYGDSIGIVLDGLFLPLLLESLVVCINVVTKETVDRKEYQALAYLADPDTLPDKYASKIDISSSLADVNARALASAFSKKELKGLLTVFRYGSVSKLTPDGEYKVLNLTNTLKAAPEGKKQPRIGTCEGFTFYVSSSLVDTVTVDSKIKVKDGEAFIGDTKLGGEGVDVLNIPAEIGWSATFVNMQDIDAEGKYKAIVAENGDLYWAPLAVTNISKLMSPIKLGEFVLTVTSLNKKDDKVYPKVDVKF